MKDKYCMKSSNAWKKIMTVTASVFVLSCVIMFISVKSRGFSEVYSKTVSAFLRTLLSAITGIFPFSLAEALVVILAPIAAVFTVFELIRFVILKKKSALRHLSGVLSAVFLFASLFINTFGVCYNRNPIEISLGLDKKSVSTEELVEVAQELRISLGSYAKQIDYLPSGASKLPYSWKELNKRIDKGYEKLINEYDFFSSCHASAKKIFLSKLMTYTHISGIYMPLTGEANVNTNYPDYVVAYSTAHEKAHQRGIAGEDEANFAAFLACVYSEDSYLIYCAYMNMYDYYLSAVRKTDYVEYKRLSSQSSKEILGEMSSYYEFFERYSNSAASHVANQVNDTYLKTLGQSEGVESYGLVIELMTAYYKKNSLNAGNQ